VFGKTSADLVLCMYSWVLECRVLGPAEVVVDGVGVELGGPLSRRLVTALVAAGEQPVSDRRLIEAVWGSDEPERRSAALHVYVSRLRRAFGPRARELLERTASGYRLRLAPGTTDVARFSREFDEGRRLLTQGQPELAVRVLTDALDLWRGAAFEDLPASEFIDGARSRLTELREAAVEVRLAARGRGTGEGRGRRLSSFLGREAELDAVAAALAGCRLVTVTGPAGVGKSRLAIEYLADRFEGDGPWLVRLAEVSHPGGITSAIADVMGVAEQDGDVRGAVVHALAARPGLLVLDNCEHLVDSVAELVIDLLETCPDLRVLTTSRVHLGVDGEMVVPVSPLPVVADDGSTGPAVALLLDRVRAVRPDWVPSAHEEVSARRVAQALDGLPLALELAAARARLLGLDEIAERLNGHLGVLGTVPRGSLSPHASLQAAIGWSVEKLPEADRALLVRLWPFDRGFTLAAAEAVCPSEVRVLESLSSLVARSVVVADTTANPTRYRLLETLRAYCREHDPDPGGTLESHARRRRNHALGSG